MRHRKAATHLLGTVLLLACVAGPVYHQTYAQAQQEFFAPAGQAANALPTKMRAATAAERNAAIASIETQLKAFRDDDYEKAQKYQARELRENFETLDQFRRMMKQGYPQFANYKSAKFGEARASEDGRIVEIPITLTGKDGVTVKADYVLVKEDGEYRVASVFGGSPPATRLAPQDVV